MSANLERKKIERRASGVAASAARGARSENASTAPPRASNGHSRPRLPVWEFDTPTGRTLVVYGELARATATLTAAGVRTWVGAPRHVGWWDGSRVEMFEPGVRAMENWSKGDRR